MNIHRGTALLLSLAISGAAAGFAPVCAYAEDTGLEADSRISSVELSPSETVFSYSNVADVAEAVMPAIVAITNKSVQEVTSFFYGEPLQYETTSAGSGIIIGTNDTELLICSNNHVVEDASELTVTFINDESVSAVIKGTDPSVDLAVVAVSLEDISEDTMSEIRIAKIGSSDALRVGEQVVAIGNALGYGQSVTTGIISAKDRSIGMSGSQGNNRRRYQFGFGFQTEEEMTTYDDLLQTDAAINPGNSGGALLNMNAEVIGINSAKAGSSGVEGMGYAIPIDKAMPILSDLMTRVPRVKLEDGQNGYLGFDGQDVSYQAIFLYGIPEGIYVTDPGTDTPAANAGLEEGDIVTSFDGKVISGVADLQKLLPYYAPGEEVELGIYRSTDRFMGYEEMTLTVVMGDRNQMQ